jgi:uncharacterized iron-regulated membrane protein
MKLFHKIIFWTHLLAGVIAGLVIFTMSFTGVVLMYEPQISEYSEWRARWVTPQAKRLPLDELVEKVREANPDSRPAFITVKSDSAASVVVNLGRENTVFINPYTGELLAACRQPATGFVKLSIGIVGWEWTTKAVPSGKPSRAPAT